MNFCRATHLLMFLSLGILTFIIRTGLPILVELIDLVNSAIIFLSQMNLLTWLTFLLRPQTVILIVLLFWIYFFLLTLVFILQCLSLHWEILIMLLSQFPLTAAASEFCEWVQVGIDVYRKYQVKPYSSPWF